MSSVLVLKFGTLPTIAVKCPMSRQLVSQTPVAQSRMLLRASAERPEELAIGALDRYG